MRYHPDLPPNAKLLYGEITALCSREGYCWAQNPYFADLYRTHRITISKWIRALADAGFIRVEVDKQAGNTRRISLREDDGQVELLLAPFHMTAFQEARGHGYVYLLEGGGFYKIGKASNLDRRVLQIVPKLPFECQLVHAIASDDCLRLEQWIHRRFDEWRLNGEWFGLTAEHVRWFREQKELNRGALL